MAKGVKKSIKKRKRIVRAAKSARTLRQNVDLILRVLFFIILSVFFCYFYIKNTLEDPRMNLVPEKIVAVPQSDISFMYGEEEEPTIIEHEQPNEDLIAELIEQVVPEEYHGGEVILEPTTDYIEETTAEKLAALIETDVSFGLEPKSSSSVYELYEEALPETIEVDKKTIVKKAAKKPNGKGVVIAIVIDDMGISPSRTKDINSLKAPITSSFLIYSRNLDRQMGDSLRAGHEVMVHVPMEAKSKIDTAPDVLTTKMNKEEIQDNFKKMLKKFHNIRGVNNHMGSKFTEDGNRMRYIMEVLKEEGLFFLDSKTSALSKGKAAAEEYQISYVGRNIFLDNRNDLDYILNQLAITEKVASKNGYAIAIGHPKSQTYLALKEWIPEAQLRGFKLVHISDIVERLN